MFYLNLMLLDQREREPAYDLRDELPSMKQL